MLSANLFGILLAITSALMGGSGDFMGGRATRRAGPMPILYLSSLSGLILMVVCAFIWHEGLPGLASTWGWAAAAGFVGVIGMMALYSGLSLGHTASVAPTSGVIAAAIPVVFTIFTSGWPGSSKLIGFGLALLGIWFVSQPAQPADKKITSSGLLLACEAGLGFGLFFILLGQVQPGVIFVPLVIVRGVSLMLLWLLMWSRRIQLPALVSNPDAWGIGVVDGLATLLFVLARQFTRLDVAAVLVSLYPAVTMLLASLVLKEVISRKQWFGAGLCLVAIVMITI